jgi:hypothetical protein
MVAEMPFRPAATTECDELMFDDSAGGTPASEEEDEAIVAIHRIFRRKLSGSRRLRRQMREAELRAAREWLAIAMKDLREKRAYKPHARYMFWRMRRIRSSDLIIASRKPAVSCYAMSFWMLNGA